MRINFVICYIEYVLKVGVQLSVDGVNDAETCSCNIRTYVCVSNVHSLVL